MWTVPLLDKSAETVVAAIKTTFMTSGPSFLLHTDNGREFRNNRMDDMLQEFDVRHVRGRARCPWIQGQVERANQTIKWMIGSMLMSLDLTGKWYSVREEATYAYNTMRHSTTGNTPLTLFYGPPIRQIMQDDVIETIIENVSQVEVVETENEVSETDDIPVDELNPLNLNSLIPENLADELEETNVSQEQTVADIRESARDSAQRAANRMIDRSMWRNDFVPFQIGSRVLIRPELIKTKLPEPEVYTNISIPGFML
ncbi:Retrovirus-related Pol polyprotein from transposon [Nosema granulosis]|uniref:Retrovirus-related Pol polyprotein from transposon n=1 Tax=Nosema granulosis TaxID=83296 RepID=A0A9P6KZH4_9MICR|nr:Retrovirus-related Pol polyprotein from transposon [Nosema granulosis]